jgi:hypothetical protein
MLPFWDIRGNLNSLNKIINKHKEAQDKSERDNIVISLVAKKKKKKIYTRNSCSLHFFLQKNKEVFSKDDN